MVELIEKVVLDTRRNVWVALSMRGCGILAQATVGKPDGDFIETRRIALAFAHQVIQSVGLSPDHERVPTPQVLIDAADRAINSSETVQVICTTWQALPEGIKICSVGSNSVLIFEGDVIKQTIAPHNFNELLRSQGTQVDERGRGGIVTHALGARNNKNSCSIDDVRVTSIPLLPITTIAVIAEWRLARDIIQSAVPRNELSSFIDAWDGLAKRARTSVLISL